MIFSVLGLEMLDKDHRYGTFCSKYVRIKPKFYFYYRQCCRHWIRTNSSWRPCPSLMAIEYRCGIKMRLVCLALAALPQVLFIWMQTLFTRWIQPQFVDQMQGFFTFIAPFSSLFHSLFTRVIFLKCQLPLRWDRRPKNDKDRPQTTPHPELRGEFWGTVGVARDAIESSTRLVYNGMICFFLVTSQTILLVIKAWPHGKCCENVDWNLQQYFPVCYLFTRGQAMKAYWRIGEPCSTSNLPHTLGPPVSRKR